MTADVGLAPRTVGPRRRAIAKTCGSSNTRLAGRRRRGLAVRGRAARARPAVLVERCDRDRRLHSGRDLLLRPRYQASTPGPGGYSDLPAVPQHDPVDADAGVQAVHGVLRPGRTVEAPAARDLRHLRRRHRGLRGAARPWLLREHAVPALATLIMPLGYRMASGSSWRQFIHAE